MTEGHKKGETEKRGRRSEGQVRKDGDKKKDSGILYIVPDSVRITSRQLSEQTLHQESHTFHHRTASRAGAMVIITWQKIFKGTTQTGIPIHNTGRSPFRCS